jgi:hypothetical protein
MQFRTLDLVSGPVLARAGTGLDAATMLPRSTPKFRSALTALSKEG